VDSYPSLSVALDSTIEFLDGIKTQRAENGDVQAWSMWSAQKVGKMVLKHAALSSAQRTTLESFYTAHRTVKITHNSRLTNYQTVTCLMTSPPQFVPSKVPGCWDATANLLGA